MQRAILARCRVYSYRVAREETPVRSVQRALELLSAVAHGEEMPLAQLAETTSLAPSTAHRLLGTLVDLGFVQQDLASRRYGAGHRLLGLVSAAEQRVAAVRAAALPHMTALAAGCGETAHLTILDGAQVIFVDQVLGAGTIRMEVKVGTRMDAHVTAAGKALLAWQPETYLNSLLEAGLQRFTPHTLTDPHDVRRELAQVRRRGWATEIEEHESGAACVAAPILAATGPPLASLSISGPTSRLRPRQLGSLGARIREAAEGVARSLESSGAPQPDGATQLIPAAGESGVTRAAVSTSRNA
jgi:IclR family acetate operon transcriptional repressor